MSWSKKNDIFALMVGHGTQLNGVWDSGCTYGNYTEAGLMLKIATVAVKYLRKNGIRVLSDADAKNNRNMKSSVAWANKRGCKLYMSLHCDYKLASAGVAPLYVSAKGKTMATTVGKYVAKKMGMKWKGAFKRKDLYELNATKMTSVIFEAGAIKADLRYLKDYKAYGKYLAYGIMKYIGVEPVKKTNAEKLLASAEKVTTDMKKLGFKYTVSGNASSWTQAKKKKTSNCATMASYSLQVANLIDEGQYFYIDGDITHYKGDGTEARFKQIFRTLHPHTSPKKTKLQKGDICGYGKPAHTQIFDGWKDGVPIWYSYGPTDVGKDQPVTKKTYNTKKISTILRFK